MSKSRFRQSPPSDFKSVEWRRRGPDRESPGESRTELAGENEEVR